MIVSGRPKSTTLASTSNFLEATHMPYPITDFIGYRYMNFSFHSGRQWLPPLAATLQPGDKPNSTPLKAPGPNNHQHRDQQKKEHFQKLFHGNPQIVSGPGLQRTFIWIIT